MSVRYRTESFSRLATTGPGSASRRTTTIARVVWRVASHAPSGGTTALVQWSVSSTRTERSTLPSAGLRNTIQFVFRRRFAHHPNSRPTTHEPSGANDTSDRLFPFSTDHTATGFRPTAARHAVAATPR